MRGCAGWKELINRTNSRTRDHKNVIALRKCRRLGEGDELFPGCGMEIQANLIRISSGKGPAAGMWVMLDSYFISM